MDDVRRSGRVRKRTGDQLSQFEPPKKKAKTAKERAKEFRDTIKEDPHKYALFREHENIRNRQYRARRSEEAITRNKELGRIRQKQYRERKKLTEPQVIKTRKTVEKERKQWSDKQQKWRSKLTESQKAEINRKRREAYAAKKANKQCDQSTVPTAPQPATPEAVLMSPVTPPRSGNSIRQARFRFRSKLKTMLPKSRTVRADLLSNTLATLTPRSKAALNEKVEIISPKAKKKLNLCKDVASAVKEQFQKAKLKRSSKEIAMRRIIANAVRHNAEAAAYIGVSAKLRKTLLRIESPDERKQRSDSLPKETVDSVREYFEGGSNSLPDARSAVIKNGEAVPRKILDVPLRTLYDQYCAENRKKVSFSKFKKLKPTTVLPFTSHKYRECLCEYCANIDLKLKALNAHLPAEERITDRYCISKMTLCEVQPGQCPKKACLDRRCEDCGIDLIDEKVVPLLEVGGQLTYEQWEQVEKRLTKVRKHAEGQELVTAVKASLAPFSRHLFNAKWQYEQYKSIVSEVPKSCVVMCMDFGENYSCRPEDAPQGCHWSNIQITLHPVVCTYPCTDCEGAIVTDTVMYVSQDLGHDYHAVSHFTNQTVQLLKEEGLEFERIIQYSDGAPTQYKNRVAFADSTFGREDCGVMIEKHFFGSRHGKGPCDREIGVVKKCVARAVRARMGEIGSARQLFDFCCVRLRLPRENQPHSHSRRRFVFVERGVINRERPSRTETKPVPNTRKLHCIKGVAAYELETRELSCFCNGCRSGDRCENLDITGPWSTYKIRLSKKPAAARQKDVAVDPAQPLEEPAGLPVASLPEKADAVTSLPEKDDAVTSLPEKDDAVTSLPEKDDAVTSLPEKDDAVTSLPEKADPVTSLPEKDDAVTSLPEKDDPVTSLPEKDDAVHPNPAHLSEEPADLPVASQDPPTQSFPEKADAVTSLPEKDDAVTSLPEKADAVTSLPEKDDAVTSLPEKDDAVTSLPEKADAVTSLPEKAAPVASLPEKDDAVASLPEKADAVTSLPEKDDAVTSLPEKDDAVTSLPEKDDAVTSLPEKDDAVASLPEKDDAVASFPEKDDAVASLPEKDDAVTSLPEKDDAVTSLPEKADTVASLPEKDDAVHPNPAHLSEEPADLPAASQADPRIGDYVKVLVLPPNGDKRKGKVFIGMVEAVTPTTYYVRFLKKSSTHYVWSAIHDRSILEREDIIEILAPPAIDGRARHFFSF